MATSIFKIALKSKVKDTLTPFKGTVVGRTQFLFGCVRYAVQSDKLEEGKRGTPQWFDESQLKVSTAAEEKAGVFKFSLGDDVKDTITPFAGVVTARTEMINSTPRYGVQSRVLQKGAPANAEWMDEEQIVLVKKSTVEKAAPAGSPRQGPRPDAQRRADYSR